MHSGGRSYGYAGKNKIYVDGGIPGEMVNVSLERSQRAFRVGNINGIDEISIHRIVPFCEHAGWCGGCNWQHMDYPAQLHWKKQLLLDALKKYEIETPEVPAVIGSPQLLAYRNKAEYAFNDACRISPENTTTCAGIGFHAGDSRDTVFDIHQCYLLPEPAHSIALKAKQTALEKLLPFYNYHGRSGLLRHLTLRTTSMGDLMLILGITRDDERIMDFINQLLSDFPEITSAYYAIVESSGQGLHQDALHHVSGKRYLTEQLGALSFRISPTSFYQPNPLQAAAVYKQVKEFAQLSGKELVYDLYTGIGSIACYIAPQAGKVIGIEGNSGAIDDAIYNARLNNIENTYFLTGDILQTFTPSFVEAHGKPDAIILDPPRSGTLIEIKKTILQAAPPKIVYVSCNPVSLAWDLKQLCENYVVTAIRAFDMFPHTHHVETVVLLRNKSSAVQQIL